MKFLNLTVAFAAVFVLIFPSLPVHAREGLHDEPVTVQRPRFSARFAKTRIFTPKALPYSQEHDLELTDWLSLPSDALSQFGDLKVKSGIGLTSMGELYQVVQVNGKSFARLLSGRHEVAEFELVGEGLNLIARDSAGAVWYYDLDRWEDGELRSEIPSILGWSAAGAAVAIAVTPAIANLAGDELTLTSQIMVGAGVAAFEVVRGFVRVLKKSEWPDGFVRTSFRVPKLSQLTNGQLSAIASRADLRERWFDCVSIVKNPNPRPEFLRRY